MKRILGVVIAAVMVVSCFASFSVSAEEVTDENGFVILNGDMLIGYEGTGGDIVIPNGVRWIISDPYYRPVFLECPTITSIYIPESVENIANQPFGKCISLSAINVSENNLWYTSVDGVLFDKEMTTLIRYPEGKVGATFTVPVGVTKIESRAFLNCIQLTSVSIADSVEYIGSQAFYACKSLKEVNLGNGVNSFGVDTFFSCDSLKYLKVPESVELIYHADGWYPLNYTPIVIKDSYAHKWCVEDGQQYVLFISSLDSVSDVFDVMQIIVSGAPIIAEQEAIADLNKDSKVDAADALVALKILINK